MNTPTWAQLHAMEPGLRPDNGLVLEHGEWTLNPYYKEAGIDDEIAYSLCRDRAFDWIAQEEPYWYLQRDNWGWTWWEAWSGQSHETVPNLTDIPTRDEALRAACAAVIGAK